MKIFRYIFKLFLFIFLFLILTELLLWFTAYILKRNQDFLFFSSNKKIIYCIGDSFTYGQGLSRNESYPAILKRLFEENKIEDIDVKNLGLPGRSSSDACFRVASIVNANSRPFLIIIMTGWNVNNNDLSLHLKSKNHKISTDAKFRNNLDKTRIFRMLHQLLTLQKRSATINGVKFVPMSVEMSLYDFLSYQEICYKNLSKIIDITSEKNVPVILLNYPYQTLPENTYNLTNEYYHFIFGKTSLKETDYLVSNRNIDDNAINSVIRYVSEKREVPLIDIHKAFASSNDSGLYQDDWHHPSKRGAEIIAETVYTFIMTDSIYNIFNKY